MNKEVSKKASQEYQCSLSYWAQEKWEIDVSRVIELERKHARLNTRAREHSAFPADKNDLSFLEILFRTQFQLNFVQKL